MKTIGLPGGISWESSIEYYRMINETVQARLGGLHEIAATITATYAAAFCGANGWSRPQ